MTKAGRRALRAVRTEANAKAPQRIDRDRRDVLALTLALPQVRWGFSTGSTHDVFPYRA
jgi:hypothetical protein